MIDLTNIEQINPSVYYSVKQTMELTGLKKTTFYKYVKERKLKASYHKSNHQFFKGTDIKKFLLNFY